MEKNQSSSLQSTLKSGDTEEWIDILFYRRLGFAVAKISARLGIRPNTITIISIFWGVLAGHLYYYNDLYMNILGIISLIIANTLDSADGQLARMTNDKTQLGRILDGLAGNFWFVSIYLHLALRFTNEGYGLWIWILFGVTGLCHIFQAAIADYYRNAHLYFLKGETGSEFHTSRQVREQLKNLSWSKNFGMKLFTYSYLNYTLEQELFTGKLKKLTEAVRLRGFDQLPEGFREQFRQENKSLMKYTNILTFNTRAVVLWVSLLTFFPLAYWIFELTVLNAILLYMITKQEQISGKYLTRLSSLKTRP